MYLHVPVKGRVVSIANAKQAEVPTLVPVQMYPAAWYELGWTYRTLGDCEAVGNNMEAAVEWWAKAYECLHTLLGPTAEVQSIKGRLLVQTAGDSREKLEEAIRLLQAV